VDAWNAWRAQNGDVVPDLSGADLDDTDLGSVNFSGVNLSRGNLSEANLHRANLRDAELTYQASLSGANLREAGLSEADLTQIRGQKGTKAPARAGGPEKGRNSSPTLMRAGRVVGLVTPSEAKWPTAMRAVGLRC